MTLIILYYYTQLEQLIFKNIWNHAVLERLNYGKYFQWFIWAVECWEQSSSWVLRAIKWKGDGSVQSGSCIQGHHIFKNIWNSAVLERLNYDPYAVVVLNMCLYPQEYATPPHLPSRYPSWKWGSSDSVHAGSLFLGKYLYSDTVSATHLHASGRLAVQKLVEIESGDEEQNCQIN